MLPANPNRFPCLGLNAGPRPNRLRLYLEQPREATAPASWTGQGTGIKSADRSALTAEDIRIHAWLTERLMLLHHERRGFWPRLRRFLFGNRQV
jgi:hypothetical protein